MIKFREWYLQRHSDYPGIKGEETAQVFERLADAFAEYVDEAMREIRPKALKREPKR